MEFIYFALIGLGALLVIISLVPLIRSDKWMVRIFDYPRSQKFWINLVLLVAFVAVSRLQATFDLVFAAALLLNQLYLFSLIRDYTRLAPIQMKQFPAGHETIRLLVANVYQDNRDVTKCLNLIRSCDPQLVLLVETDQWWCEKISVLKQEFEHHVFIPKENTYGMILLSKVEIVSSEVRYLVEDDVPSIKADLRTAEGISLRFYGLHPKPPVPGHSDDSTDRDAEILLVGKESKKCRQPVIVAGDLNDVAWSYTTNLFLKISSLLDPRIGRGFFSTFHAKYPLMRWPLDHVFCSSHFFLHNLRVLPEIGSDHFPILIEVGLMPDEIAANEQEEKHADADEEQIATEKVDAAR